MDAMSRVNTDDEEKMQGNNGGRVVVVRQSTVVTVSRSHQHVLHQGLSISSLSSLLASVVVVAGRTHCNSLWQSGDRQEVAGWDEETVRGHENLLSECHSCISEVKLYLGSKPPRHKGRLRMDTVL